MKKTNVELLEFFGLKVGDKIKVDGYYYPFVIVEENDKIFAKRENCLSSWDYYDIGTLTDVLLNCDYEIIIPKKIGDMKCEDFVNCKGCPFALDNRASDVCCIGNGNKTFREIVELTQKELDAIKAELDKEVQECEK